MSLAPAPPPLPKPKLPGVKEVWTQLWADLFGKDVQDTATFSYEWVADQTGHFALGFELTYLLYLDRLRSSATGSGGSAWLGGWSSSWSSSLKEARGLLQHRGEGEGRPRVSSSSMGWKSSATRSRPSSTSATGALVAGFGDLLDPALRDHRHLRDGPRSSSGWATAGSGVKLTFQQAGMPYLYRLANFPGPIDKARAEFIVKLIEPAGRRLPLDELPPGHRRAGRHGQEQPGRRARVRVRHPARDRPVHDLGEAPPGRDQQGQAWDKPEFNDGRILWPWQTSDLLIVDDVDVLSDHVTKADAEREQVEDGRRARAPTRSWPRSPRSSWTP